MLESYTETRFAVARRNKIISDGYATVTEAKQQHAHLSEQMEALSLTPDLHVVTVEVEHTVGKHQAYEEPTEDEAEITSETLVDGARTTVATIETTKPPTE